jgi:DNA uptake protein ComE-like DNA-binding protein
VALECGRAPARDVLSSDGKEVNAMRSRAVAIVVLGVALVGTSACSRTDRHTMSQRTSDAWGDVTGKRTEHQVDLNTAPAKELAKLPGMTDDDAARIVAHRPYGSVKGLLRKNVLGQQKYDQIRDYVYVTNRQGEKSYGD